MFKKLAIENFKCFDQQFSFDLKKVNLFTGYNGRGKSTAMQVLLLLAQSLYENKSISDLVVNGMFCQLGLFEELINTNNTASSVKFSIDTDFDGDLNHVELAYEEKSDRKGTLSALKLGDKDIFESSGEIGRKKVSRTSSLGPYPEKLNSIFRNFVYVSADRLGPTPFEVKHDLSDNNPIGNNGAFRLNVLSGKDTLKKELSDVMVRIMEGGAFSIAGEDKKDQDILKLYFETSDQKKRVTSVNSGFGYSYILPILIAALSMKNGCLFIENPEAHLHPAAQSRLIKELIATSAKNDIQLFIETHSEHVVNAARLCVLDDNEVYSRFSNDDVSLYFFDKDYSINKLNMDKDAQIDQWPLGFFDQAENDTASILKMGLFKC